MSERRIPCPMCKALIVEGARKCRSCKQWIGGPPKAPQPRFMGPTIAVTSAVATVLVVIVTRRQSPVGDAPPLTPLAGDSAAASAGPRPPGLTAPVAGS